MTKAKLRLMMPFQCWCIKGRGLHKHYKITELFKARKELKRYNSQSCKCFCPSCDNELCGSNSWICSQGKDLCIEFYKCSSCGTASKWDFGSPAPLLIEVGKIRKNGKLEISGICQCDNDFDMKDEIPFGLDVMNHITEHKRNYDLNKMFNTILTTLKGKKQYNPTFETLDLLPPSPLNYN